MIESHRDNNSDADHTPYLLLVSVGNSRVRSALATASVGGVAASGVASLQRGGTVGGGSGMGVGGVVGGVGGVGGGGGGEIHRWSAVRNDEATAASLLRPAFEHFGWTSGNETEQNAEKDDDRRTVHVVLASVNPPLGDRLVSELLSHPRVSGVSRTFNAWPGSLGRASAGGRSVVKVAGTASGGAARAESDGVAILLNHNLENASTLGQDRALNAIAAYAISNSACIVIDAGTAITVDFIDGQGAFCGGCILPGVQLMADALHEHTAALPKITPNIKHGFAVQTPAVSSTSGPAGSARLPKANPRKPIDPYADEDTASVGFSVDDSVVEIDDDDRSMPDDPPPLAAPLPFGRDTSSAMTAGIAAAAVGAVHLLINRYAEYYEAYPRIIATGGDAPKLFESDELVEHIVPDLTLRGVLECVKQAIKGDNDGDDGDDEDGGNERTSTGDRTR